LFKVLMYSSALVLKYQSVKVVKIFYTFKTLI